jgi:hypothetical protein
MIMIDEERRAKIEETLMTLSERGMDPGLHGLASAFP